MVVGPRKKKWTIKGDRCDLVKDSLMVKSIFSLEYKNEKLWMGEKLTLVE